MNAVTEQRAREVRDSRRKGFREAVEALPHIAERLAKGQQFNAYDSSTNDDDDEDQDCLMHVCLGPINDAAFVVSLDGRARANMVADALTLASVAATEAAQPEGVVPGGAEVREVARALSNVGLVYRSGALPGSNKERDRTSVDKAVRFLETLAWTLEATGDEDRCNRLLDQFAFHAGIRAIDPPRLSSFPREVAVRAMLAALTARQDAASDAGVEQ